jgi:uncharacterized Fe-S center protein
MAAAALPGSKICEDHSKGDLKGEDKFRLAHPSTSWMTGLKHAEKIGLGNISYELIKV